MATTAKIALFISTALVLFTYAGYPVWMWVRSRLRPRPWHRAEIFPSISIVMAVHNGAALIRQRLEDLLAVDYPPERTEVIAVCDGATDGTEQIAGSISNPRLRVFSYAPQRGKAAAVNLGMQHATGEVVLFVDVRPRLQPASVRHLVSNFADPSVGCAAGTLILESGKHDAAARAVGSFYWRYEQWIRACESAVDSSCGVYGGFYAVRRELLTELPEGFILDDMYQPLSVVRQGPRCVLDPAAHVCDTWPADSRNEFHRKVRTLAGNFQMLRLAPWVLSAENRLRYRLLAHKFLRLLVPALLPVILIASYRLRSDLMYRLLLFAQIGFYSLALLPNNRLPLLGRISGVARGFCMLNLAAVVGCWKFLFTRGPLWKIWVQPGAAAPQALASETGSAVMVASGRR